MRVCGIAGILFSELKEAQSIENTGFSEGVKKWPLFSKVFCVFLFSPLGSALYRRLRGNTMPRRGTSQNREARIRAGLQVSPPLSFAFEIGANR